MCMRAVSYTHLDVYKRQLFNFTTWPQSGLESWPPNMEYPSGVRVYDAYNPEARDIYWKYLVSSVSLTGTTKASGLS